MCTNLSQIVAGQVKNKTLQDGSHLLVRIPPWQGQQGEALCPRVRGCQPIPPTPPQSDNGEHLH